MDNASVHHKNLEEIKRVCDIVGVRIILLPPYSPDYNPIEESFGVLKAYIRRWYHYKRRNFNTYQEFLEWAVVNAGTGVRAQKNARGHFRNAGINGVAID